MIELTGHKPQICLETSLQSRINCLVSNRCACCAAIPSGETAD